MHAFKDSRERFPSLTVFLISHLTVSRVADERHSGALQGRSSWAAATTAITGASTAHGQSFVGKS